MSANGTPGITVVIPAFRRTESLREAVLSVFAQDLPYEQYELVVVDSSPDENNARMLEALKAEATCALRVFRKSPEGPGPSRNMGAHHARGEFIAFMDSDCCASPQWLREALAAFAPDIGLVQGQTAPDPHGKLGVFTHTVIVNAENHIYETCNMIYRHAAFDQAGGFPPDMDPLANEPVGGEDVELAWAVKRSGWKSVYAPGALVYHEVVPIDVKRWIYGKRLIVWPRIAKRAPEVRRFFVARVFYDLPQALLCLALAGIAAAMLTPWALLMCLPYVWRRATEHTGTLTGFKRILRVGAYGVKDAVSLGVLVAGSIRHRSLVL